MTPFRRQGRFTDDEELNRRLVAFEHEVENALRRLDAGKADRFVPVVTAKSEVLPRFGDLVLLDTAGQASRVLLPEATPDREGQSLALVVLSAANAVTVYPTGQGVLLDGTSSHSPVTNVLTVYRLGGGDWWIDGT